SDIASARLGHARVRVGPDRTRGEHEPVGVAQHLAIVPATRYDPGGARSPPCQQGSNEVPDLSVEVGGCGVSHTTNYRSASVVLRSARAPRNSLLGTAAPCGG